MSVFIDKNGIDLENEGVTPNKQVPEAARRGTVTVDGYNLGFIAIEPEGTAVGTALLIPGYSSSAETFACIMAPLARRGYRVVTFSQRGQPLSDGPDTQDGYSLPRLGQDVHDVCEQLGLPAKVHLLGHSFGGIVAAEAAVINPTRFASITMWNSGPSFMGGALPQQAQVLKEHGTNGFFLADRAVKGIPVDAPLTAVEQYYYDRLFATQEAQLVAGMDILMNQTDRIDELADLGLPALVSHGAQDDAWPHAMQQDMADRLSADYWVIARAGHSAHMDRSYLSAQLLADFWDENN
jgi:pimeloyl-ACP methyl ester carboxylesterase